jgi:methionyl-tRNA formyltransferase
MRILFAGSPRIAIPSLEALVNLQLAGEAYTLVGVLTNPDVLRGRHGTPEPIEVSAAATLFSERLKSEGHPQILLFKPEKLSSEIRESLAHLKPDILVSFAYGHIFGPQFLSLFPLGGINIHPSLLPKYRGPSPIQAAILNRDRETGITIQTIASEIDTGTILLQERFPLNGRETAASLNDLVAWKAAALLPVALQRLADGPIQGQPQDNREVSYCSFISKGDGCIDWSLAAAVIDARIRAFTPWPLSWTFHKGQYLYILEGAPYKRGETLIKKVEKVEKAAKPGTVLGVDEEEGILVQTGDGVFGITRLQYRAKKALAWRAFLNGARDFLNTSLG